MDCLNHWIPACAGMTGWWILACAGRLRASSAACSRPACGRQALLYHGSVFGALSRTAELTARPASMQAYILVGVSINDGGGAIPIPVVIPAKAGIQEGGPGG